MYLAAQITSQTANTSPYINSEIKSNQKHYHHKVKYKINESEKVVVYSVFRILAASQ